ncbi:ABC-F family ATP-binding cassette domain-containing protein [Burkholderia dolosa]|uniref:ABC-F family ATP-binding cassette domain-containing protein n=1 Tax=Burkholderia dolosa TaxID=152500 RepID=UPI001B8EDE1B|nr:ATP-binding cassette domain-containing protein [Burkholderia dolosa]MBR8459046.1 ABC-F family ATP-binding cassette domain-containing protein [Burkholderia dolosa]MDN7420580.1 ATP-binding cassette domain-containing protein [Burkholderia dolosa]
MAAATPTGALVALHHVSFRFDDGFTLFDSLDLVVDRVPTGIVGRNGAGKSVLAQLIAGRCAPSSGAIDRQTSVAYVAQQHADMPAGSQSVAAIAGLDVPLAALARLAQGEADAHDFDSIGERWDLAERLRAALDAAALHDVQPDAAADTLSGGQLARVALIGALLSGAGLLVLDEPTNHLDAPGRAWLCAALDGWRGGLVVVSHDRALLGSLQRIVEVTPHGVRSYGGNYALYRAQRDAEDAAAQAALDHARAERSREKKRLEREHDTIQRHAAGSLRDAKTANLSSMARQSRKGAARSIMGAVRRHHGELKATLDERVHEAAARVDAGAPVLVSLPGTEVSARRQLFTLECAQPPWPVDADAPPITWSASGAVRIALTGPNGCGKSTLLRMLAGELAPRAGECSTHVSTAYLDQRLALLDRDRSIVEQLGLLDTPLAEGELRSRLALLQLDASRATQPVHRLSGGERLKAALACALWRGTPAQLLLLDEPTNHLDLESVRAIEAALTGFPGAIVVASHDAAFLAALDPTHTMQWHRDGWRYEPVASLA